MTVTADALFSDTKSAPTADTPVLRQWVKFKETHPGFLLLFKMGDFYEAFHDDAETLGRVCGVTVTTRSKGDGAPSVTMAGVPFHSVEGYLRKLIAAGHKVAICEDVTSAGAKAKGAVKREVKRIVTPETLAGDAPAEPAAAPTTPLQATAQRGGLLDALTALAAVIPGRPFKPVLACVRLETTADRLLMEATNLEQWARHAQATVQVESRGAVLVPLGGLLRVCQEYDDSDTLKIQHDGDWLIVRGESAHRRLPAVAVSEWPALPKHWPAPLGTVPASSLRRILSRVAFAAGKEPLMYAYHARPLYADGKTLRAVAGEGHVFAEASCPCLEGLKLPEAGVLIPQAAVSALLKALDLEGDEKAEAGIWADDRGAAFFCGDYSLRTNLIEGHFPPYTTIIHQPREYGMESSAGPLLGVLRRAALGLEEHANGLRLTLGPNGLTAVANDTPAAAESRLPLKWAGPDGFSVGFHPKYLFAALDAVRDEPIAQLHFAHPHKPALLTAPNFRCVICPFDLQA